MYSYGLHGAPAVGLGLPGLPVRSAGFTPSQSGVAAVCYTRIVTPGKGVVAPPEGAKMMRVAAIAGGGGAVYCGGRSAYPGTPEAGGGGGCAASGLVPAVPFEYVIGAGGARATAVAPVAAGQPYTNAEAGDGGATTVSGLGIILEAEGGHGGSYNGTQFSLRVSVAGKGGIGKIGAYIRRGGDGAAGGSSTACGGGAAGPNGNGQNGADSSTAAVMLPDNLGWGVGGGSAGISIYISDTYRLRGGAGAGMCSPYTVFDPSTYPASGGYGPWGRSAFNGNGGEMGGGGTYSGFSGHPGSGNGGVGGIVVEWLY